MNVNKTPELARELYKRIRLVRRDMGDLLFHFTRAPEGSFVKVSQGKDYEMTMSATASAVLHKILYEGQIRGTSTWTNGYPCVCFTEAPIQEFNSIFALVELASSQNERPRYEPYGLAVSKNWLFERGGRPVIYDSPDALDQYHAGQQWRFVPYDPATGVDFSWEREWRINVEALKLDPKHTLVVVPSADEAFDLVYEFSTVEADWDDDGPCGTYHAPRWLAVSLDLFGFTAVGG